jgi:large-conductance mechanosensitive channel
MENSTVASPGPDAKRWIGLIVIGLLLGQTSLGLIVALTRDVILPALAMAMGDTSSPLSLGKRDFDFPNLLSAILQFCLAAIVAIVVNAWTQKGARAVRTHSLRLAQAPVTLSAPAPTVPVPPAVTTVPAPESPRAVTPVPSPPVPRSPAPATVAPAVASPVAATPARVAAAPQTAQPPRQFIPAAATPPQPAPSLQTPPKPQTPPPPAPQAKPAKPKKPKEVYYNIVGERITPEDDDE